MANLHSQSLSRQDKYNMDLHFNNLRLGDSTGVQGAVDRHHLPQGYESNDWASQMPNGGWAMNQQQTTMHTRSTSDHSHTASSGVLEHFNLYNRRSSVPTIQYNFQSGTHPGYNVGSEMLQGYPPMVGSQYQPMTQHLSSDPYATNPLTPLTIPTTSGGPGPHSASSPRAPWYAPQSSHPSQRLSSGLQSGVSFPQQVNQGHLTFPEAGHSSNGRGVMNRASRSNSRTHHPYHRDARQASPTQDNRHSAGSPDSLSPATSRSRIVFDGSDPGTDSDPYHSLPTTPGYTNRPMGETFEAAMKEDQRKEKQKLKKREDRKGEKVQFQRVTDLLGLDKPTKADVLEKAIEQLGGRAPTRKNEPTQALQGREQKRSERAKQVSAARNDLTMLFDQLANCMGYPAPSVPRREVLLRDVADELKRRKMVGTQFPGSHGGSGPGGYRWTA